jgi:multifunctional methyltransferase subunit TRM112
MKLFTHNILMCNSKTCKVNNYPLRIIPQKVDSISIDYNEELVKKFLRKVDYKGLIQGAKDINANIKYDFSSLNTEDFSKEEVLQNLHTLMFETVLVEGVLQCEGCGLKYPVNNGIADMVLND